MTGGSVMQTRPGSNARGSRRVLAGILVSLLAHFALFLLLLFAVPDSVDVPRREKVRLSVVDRVPKTDFDKAPLVTGIPDRPEPSDRIDGQVVTLPEPSVQQRPDSARFLSQHDIKVDREQVARVRSGAPPGERRKVSGRPRADQGRPGGDTAPGEEGGAENAERVTEKTPEPAKFSGLRGFENLLLPSAAGFGRGGGLNMRTLADQMVADGSPGYGGDSVSGASGGGGMGGGGSDDVFMGVEDEGDVTLVNSRSFKYWSFFDGVKSRVRSEWDPGTIMRSRDPYGKVFGKKDRYTILGVVLNGQGVIQQLEIVHQSGLDFLDEEAVRAFQAAGPFPNPPAGLIDGTGRIVFRFGFLLEFGSSTGSFFWQRPI